MTIVIEKDIMGDLAQITSRTASSTLALNYFYPDQKQKLQAGRSTLMWVSLRNEAVQHKKHVLLR